MIVSHSFPSSFYPFNILRASLIYFFIFCLLSDNVIIFNPWAVGNKTIKFVVLFRKTIVSERSQSQNINLIRFLDWAQHYLNVTEKVVEFHIPTVDLYATPHANNTKSMPPILLRIEHVDDRLGHWVKIAQSRGMWMLSHAFATCHKTFKVFKI